MDAKLEAVPLVDIDEEGRFKYVLIKVYGKEKSDGTEPSKLIVRGYKRAQWHGINWNSNLIKNWKYYLLLDWNKLHFLVFNIVADIYDEVYPSIRALGLDTECLGGGRIEHFPKDKLLKVYGHSTVSWYFGVESTPQMFVWLGISNYQIAINRIVKSFHTCVNLLTTKSLMSNNIFPLFW